MAMSSDFFGPAMQNIARVGQALMQDLLGLLNNQSPSSDESDKPPETPDLDQMASLQKRYLEQ